MPSIVSLETNGTYPKAKLTLTAIEKGVTQLKVKLKGGGGENGADLDTWIVLQVGELGSWPIAISYVTGQYDPKNPPEFITWKDKPGFLMINIDMDPWDGNYHLGWSIIADGEFKFGFGDGYSHYASYTKTTPEVVEQWYQDTSSSFIYSCVPGWRIFTVQTRRKNEQTTTTSNSSSNAMSSINEL